MPKLLTTYLLSKCISELNLVYNIFQNNLDFILKLTLHKLRLTLKQDLVSNNFTIT